MDTLALRIAAASAEVVDDFDPDGFTVLEDPRGPRLLLSDGQRTVVAALLTPPQALEASTENVAAAVLRGLLPDTGVVFPRSLATKQLPKGKGFEPDGEAVLQVSDPLPGLPVSTADFRTAPGLVADLARFIAALHASDAGGVADAGLVAQESQEIRDGLLAELDRGAETGKVPGALLGRWERVLETVSLWRFLPCPVHGDLSLEALRIESNALSAVSELSRLRVGDPAVDLAAVSGLLDPDEFDVFAQEYFAQRSADDAGLLDRVEFMSEFAVLQWFLATTDSGDEEAQSEATELLAELADVIGADPAAEAAPGAVQSGAVQSGSAHADSSHAASAQAGPAPHAEVATDSAVGSPSTDDSPQAGTAADDAEARTAATVDRGHASHITADIDRDRVAFRPAAQPATSSHAPEPDDQPTNPLGQRRDADPAGERGGRERWDDSEDARRRSSLLDTERTDITRD